MKIHVLPSGAEHLKRDLSSRTFSFSKRKTASDYSWEENDYGVSTNDEMKVLNFPILFPLKKCSANALFFLNRQF